MITNNGRDEPRVARKKRTNGQALREYAEDVLCAYFHTLNGHTPADLYDLFMREVEEPLLKKTLEYTGGNQSQAAMILGINRGTLRKKLKHHGLM